jgi:hypothetical protein
MSSNEKDLIVASYGEVRTLELHPDDHDWSHKKKNAEGIVRQHCAKCGTEWSSEKNFAKCERPRA